MKRLYILNGPNLNLLGKREPNLYGSHTLQEIETLCRAHLPSHIHLEFRQTNHEGELITWIQEAATQANALIINAGGLTHTSISLHDALRLVNAPIIEVHLTQPLAREPFRHHSYVSPVAYGIIAGFGINSYKLATEAAIKLL